MKYFPSPPPSDIEQISVYLHNEFIRVSDSVDTNKWENSHESITADYNAGPTPYIFADATSGAITVSLPAPPDERIFNVKKTDSSANAVTLDGGSNNIDGATTAVISTQYVSLTVYWDKTQWWIV